MLTAPIFRSLYRRNYIANICHNKLSTSSKYNNPLFSSSFGHNQHKALLLHNIYGFSKFKPPLPSDIDTANLYGYINSSDSPFLLFRQKLSQFSFGSMYNGIYDFSRQLLFTLSNDYHLGIPLSIIAISLAIRFLFLYPTILGQINSLKMKDIGPQTERYKQKLKLGQQTRNMALTKQAQRQYKMIRKEHGINMFVPMLNLLQIPFLLTWFFQLRDLANLGQVYPQLYNSPFLWITDLTRMDYALPVIAAVLTSLSLIYSPSMKKGAITNALVEKYRHLIPYLPFASLLFTIWFPATLSIYWAAIGGVQLIISLLLNYQPLVTSLGYIPKQNRVVKIPEIKYVKAVFIQQKNRPRFQQLKNNVQSKQDSKSQQSQEQGKNVQGQTIQVLANKPKSKKPNTPPKFKQRK